MMTRLLLALSVSLHATAFASTNEYRLVWADEFDGLGAPNPLNWTAETGFKRNKELQWYQANNGYCQGGRLIIEARRERVKNPNYQPGSGDWRKNREYAQYTSACLITRGKQSWQYGRFEVKARIQARDGLWPAIWFLGNEGGWPHGGEIDLMEYYGGHLLANTCWGPWDTAKIPMSTFNDPRWDEKFHVWRMDWDHDSIKLYVDDRLLNSTDLNTTTNPKPTGPRNAFRQPHYLLLNLAIGGNCGGDPSKTSFPTRYEIEYVRVYQQTTPR
jgi:beta-glucanase (GH16 family)